ncbi:MAG TPA: hypothetical protein VN151_04960, partial [Terracidiphilus sp.]|nr:hypothetical protein [Terracidiphilus sp.]
KNTFVAAGTGRFGHEVARNEAGQYTIAPGWGDAKGIVFEGNAYFGNNVDIPEDAGAVVDRKLPAAAINWNEPEFDAARPETFAVYLARHRAWMMRLFEQQFGVALRAADAR